MPFAFSPSFFQYALTPLSYNLSFVRFFLYCFEVHRYGAMEFGVLLILVFSPWTFGASYRIPTISHSFSAFRVSLALWKHASFQRSWSPFHLVVLIGLDQLVLSLDKLPYLARWKWKDGDLYDKSLLILSCHSYE